MKQTLFLSILFWTIAMPVLAELTPQELDNIHAIVKEKIKPLNIDIGTLKTDIVQLDGRLTDVEKQNLYAINVTYGLIFLIMVAIGIRAWMQKRPRHIKK